MADHQNHWGSFFKIQNIKTGNLYFEEFPQILVMIRQVWFKIDSTQIILQVFAFACSLSHQPFCRERSYSNVKFVLYFVSNNLKLKVGMVGLETFKPSNSKMLPGTSHGFLPRFVPKFRSTGTLCSPPTGALHFHLHSGAWHSRSETENRRQTEESSLVPHHGPVRSWSWTQLSSMDHSASA